MSGHVLAGEVHAEAALHGGEHLGPGSARQHPLDEVERGEVVLDQQHAEGAGSAPATGVRLSHRASPPAASAPMPFGLVLAPWPASVSVPASRSAPGPGQLGIHGGRRPCQVGSRVAPLVAAGAAGRRRGHRHGDAARRRPSERRHRIRHRRPVGASRSGLGELDDEGAPHLGHRLQAELAAHPLAQVLGQRQAHTRSPRCPVCSSPRRSKGTNTRSTSSARMPRPVSATAIRSRPGGPGSQVTSTRPPGRLYFTALDNRLSRTCMQALAVGRDDLPVAGGPPRSAMTTSARAAMGWVSSTASRHDLGHRAPASAVSSRYPDSIRAMSSTSSMRSRRWRPARRMWSTASACCAGDVVHLQELGEPEDGIERCAQLVAHPGQEVALGLAGLLGRLPRHLQPLLGLELVRDVARHHHGPGEVAVVVEHGLGPGVDGHPVAVGMAGPVAQVQVRHGTGHHADEQRGDVVEVVGVDEVEHIGSGEHLVAMAEQRRSRPR